MFRKCVLAAVAILAPTLGYSAFDFTNGYVRGWVGYNHASISDLPDARVDANGGYVVAGAIGYSFPIPIRVEGELGYRHNNLDKIVVVGNGMSLDVDLDGHLSSLSYMGNVLFDIPVCWSCFPYCGVGLGGYQEWGKATVPVLEGTRSATHIKFDKGHFAYQLIAGVNILHCNTIDCGVEYHFLDAFGNEHNAANHSVALSCRKTF